ncbi:hypothetical protein C5748_10845 [Phyllobacterium phragmitis]|uniref:LysR substrate-binding domain-containing protein n=1 Tax=Phyllobacterium phragmitis TaxID=2670329 RepID=A0A2S9ITA1_9HYPH|nr:hypothetical protein C5748_10845 [Phyllobacterium phragmitis]
MSDNCIPATKASPSSSPSSSADIPNSSPLALAILLLGGFITVFDLFVVNVAIPSMQADLGADFAQIGFVIAGYELAFGVLLIAGGRLGEPLLVALPENHSLAERASVTWADLAAEAFLVRRGGTGPQVHDHIVLRLASRWPGPSILRFDVERSSLLSMVGQGFGVTLVGAATSLSPTCGVVFLPITDEPEPVAFSAVWSPYNRDAVLRNLLALAREMSRSAQPI